MKLILNLKIKYYTKEIFKYFNIGIRGIGFILSIILIKYKPIYEVSMAGEKIGYINNKEELKESIKESILGENKNVDMVDLKHKPEYELKLVSKSVKTNEDEVISKIEENTIITYKYYEIAFNNQTLETVNTIEEAEEIVNKAKQDNKEQDLNLTIVEKYTQNEEEIKVDNIELAKLDINSKIIEVEEKQKAEDEAKKEQEKLNNMPEINGIKLAVKPVAGTITSRYGVSSRIRKSNHTGLDISAKKGTPIKAIADGTVTCAKYSGSYGNLVKIDNGNGVETWYAHTSKMYVKNGQKVKAGDTIATVGSTGNSTGPHLHLEIRVNGKHVNPQKYLYK